MDISGLSEAEKFALLPLPEQQVWLDSLTPNESLLLQHDWSWWARPKQLTPAGDWLVWLILAGRGFGKTRTGAEWVVQKARENPGCRIALVGATAADVRDTMIEGESGILAISPPDFMPVYQPSKRLVKWPNGARAKTFSAEKPRQLRGPQHHFAWADELAAWKNLKEEAKDRGPDADAWGQLMFGLRLGKRPQVCVTTTPRPIPVIRELVKDPKTHPTKGSTYENLSNLAERFMQTVVAKHEGTRLGRQELNAEILDDTPGALWSLGLFDRCRVRELPELLRIVVAVDPSVKEDGSGDECGIVIAGVGWCNCKVPKGGKRELHGFVIDDVSDHLSPEAWALRAVGAYATQRASLLVAEKNNGGGLVKVTIASVALPDGTQGSSVNFKGVDASQGKRARAEPISALYEQGKVHHLHSLPKLEDECRTWNPLGGGRSPNRLDALVWGLTELMLQPVFAVPTPTIDLGSGSGESYWRG